MTDEKLISVLRFYGDLIQGWGLTPERKTTPLDDLDSESDDVARHCAWMCGEARTFVCEGRKEKAFRWLGFIQGVLFAHGWRSLDELKKDSMP